MLRKTYITIFAVLISLSLVSSVCAEKIDGKTVLTKMLENEGKACYKAQQITVLTKPPSITSEQTVYRDGLRGMRIEYLEPKALRGEVMTDDGITYGHYIKSKNTLMMEPSRVEHMKRRADQAMNALKNGKLKVELVGSDKIAGRDAYVIEVKPKDFRKSEVRKFWVDKEKWVKLRTEETDRDGTVSSISYFTSIEFMKSIPADKFKAYRPPGVKVVNKPGFYRMEDLGDLQKKAGFSILKPSYMPPGFKPVGAGLIPFRNEKIVVLRYTDGFNALSLFETPGRVLEPGFIKNLHRGPIHPRTDIYSWRRGELNLTIVGRIPPEEMHKIADSVEYLGPPEK